MRRLNRTALHLLCACLGAGAAVAADPGNRPTLRRPVRIQVSAADAVLSPGQASLVLLRLRLPRGVRIGATDADVRMPAPTRARLAPNDCVEEGPPRFPKPLMRGVPVHLGVSRVYEGEINAAIPFTVRPDCGIGDHTLAVLLTYTPAVSAGQLSTHVDEPYQVSISVRPAAAPAAPPADWAPSLGSVPEDFLVAAAPPLHLPAPMGMMMHRLDEEGWLARGVHALFLDPPRHGKHLQMMPHPYAADSDNNGLDVGAGLALVNTTREGIMTGTIDLLVTHNEFVGTTGTVNAVSCPAAYHNYWLTAEVSRDVNRQLHLHTEDLTLGAGDRFGYELQVDLFQDPRYRFFGLGGTSDEGDETAYTQEELGGTLDLFWNAATHWRLSAGARARRVDLSRSVADVRRDYAYTADVFAGLPGMAGATIAGGRLGAVYDARNQEFHTTSGTYLRLLTEIDHGLSDRGVSPPDAYGRFTLEGRHYRSSADQRYTLLLRNTWVLTSGQDDIPFFDLPTLGGQTSLRGFELGRFYGRHSVLASAELRMSAMHLVMMGFPMDLELAPFVDAGQVFQDEDFEGDFNVNPGLSLRAVNPPNVGMIVNGAVGQDGLTLTGGVSLGF